MSNKKMGPGMSLLENDKGADNVVCTLPVEPNGEMISGVVEWLHNLLSTFDEQSREINKVTGVSRNEVLAIRMVSISPSITVSELAKRMQISSVTMVRILDRLEKKDLIARTRSNRDRRVVEISITDKAQDIDVMLGNITHDILKCCLGVSDDDELLAKLKPLQKLSSQINSNSLGVTLE